jgi:arylsulfatase A
LGDYKLIRHYEDGMIELFNLRKDIEESNNLVKAMPEKARELEVALDRWLTEQNAYLPITDPDYDPVKKKSAKRRKKK